MPSRLGMINIIDIEFIIIPIMFAMLKPFFAQVICNVNGGVQHGWQR
jgi:hypothetical protein